MGAGKLIKSALKHNKMTQDALASLLSRDPQQVRNALYRDRFQYSIAEEWLNALGYELVIRDKFTGEIYD